MVLQAGSSLASYEIVSRLGSGGMGDVFLARDRRLERRVALKVLRTSLQDDETHLRRFLQEARAASALTHPNVAIIYDVGEDHGVHFIAMEYVEGQTLADYIGAEPLAIQEILSTSMQIAQALHAAHTSGIIHRDVKPANLMITAAGVVKVLDFGLARVTAREALSSDTGTVLSPKSESGVIVGTVAYMSPEQAVGAAIDHRTDLFSLGVVLYQSATGRLPFKGLTTMDTIERIRHGEPDAIARFNSAIPAELERIIRKCLSKDPHRRYQSAADLLTDLRALAGNSEAQRLLAATGESGPHNFPANLTSFVGRRQEVEHLSQLLRSTRLLTVTGAGGSGKTRLAQQLGTAVATEYAAGAWFVDLAPVSNPDLLANMVAHALEVPERAVASSGDALIEWLKPRDVLLILDNCEHLVDPCAALAETLLRHSPRLRIVATTREALGVPGEKVWRIPSLALPPASQPQLDPENLRALDAVQLFVERAAAVAPFVLTRENARAVVDICQRLDGLPLAIELAAARVKMLAVEQIRDRLHDRFRLLAGGGRTVVARQRTLEAAVDWSYELLADAERRLLARLSVFSGGWTLEAAEQVCSSHGIDASEVLDLLSRLVDKSLVVVDQTAATEPRYRFLETIRQYGRERLFRSGETATISERHFDYFLEFARRAEPELIRRNQVVWLNRADQDHDNLRTAIEWGAAESTRSADALHLAKCLWWFWTKRGYFMEGRQRLEAALAAVADAPPGLYTRAHVGLMHLALFAGDLEGTEEMVARTVVAAQEAGDPWAESFSLAIAAILESDRGNFDRSMEVARKARDVALTSTDPNASQPLALAVRMLAYGTLQNGDLPLSSRLFEQAVALRRDADEIWSLGILLSDLAAVRVLQNQHEDAAALAREALGLCRSLGDHRGIAWSLQTFAMLEAAAGRARDAAVIYGAAEAMLESVGATGQATVTRVQDRYLTLARDAIGEAQFRAAVARGRVIPVQRVVDMVLSAER